LKRIFTVGRGEDCEKICEVFKSVNANPIQFYSLESMISAGRKGPAAHLLILAFKIASETDSAISEIKKDVSLKSVPILVFYSPFTSNADARARSAGGNDALLFPVERRELLSKAATLLNIEKRRTFKTLLSIESPAGSIMAKSDDFSSGGLSFVTEGKIDEQTEIQVQLFLLGESARLRLMAMVMRRTQLPEGGFSYGARFVNNDPSILEKVVAFVDKGK